jgi:hypothetical protein
MALRVGLSVAAALVAGHRSLHESHEFRAFLLTLISLPLFCA